MLGTFRFFKVDSHRWITVNRFPGRSVIVNVFLCLIHLPVYLLPVAPRALWFQRPTSISGNFAWKDKTPNQNSGAWKCALKRWCRFSIRLTPQLSVEIQFAWIFHHKMNGILVPIIPWFFLSFHNSDDFIYGLVCRFVCFPQESNYFDFFGGFSAEFLS